MNHRCPVLRLLFATIALLLAASAQAQTAADDDRALAQARKDLAQAAARVAELSRDRLDADAQFIGIRSRLAGRPVLGVLLAPDAQAGVRIAGVTPDGAAAASGLKSGDRLLAIDGTRVLGSTGELRVENARKLLRDLDADTPVRLEYERDGRTATAAVTPQAGHAMALVSGADGALTAILDDARLRAAEGLDIATATLRDIEIPDIAAEIRSGLAATDIAAEVREALAESGLSADCSGDRCAPPPLLSAFRWNGLNLASLDPQLGRYFGTDRGVLVLSSGDLDGLQAGDVIQRVDGRAVTTPREVMDALRDKPAQARVPIEYLRDRKSATAQVTVPKLRPLRIPAPPKPPAPPAPPRAPAAPKPPAPPAAG